MSEEEKAEILDRYAKAVRADLEESWKPWKRVLEFVIGGCVIYVAFVAIRLLVAVVLGTMK